MKKLLALCLTLAMMCSLVACGNKETENASTSVEQEIVKVEETPTIEVPSEPVDEKVDETNSNSEVQNNNEVESEKVEESVSDYIVPASVEDMTDEQLEKYNKKMEDYTEITSLNHSRFNVLTENYENSIDMMTYMIMMLGTALGGEETTDATALEEMLLMDTVLETNESFALANLVSGKTFVIATRENTENIVLENLSEDEIKELLLTFNAEENAEDTEGTEVSEESFDLLETELLTKNNKKAIFSIRGISQITDEEGNVSDIEMNGMASVLVDAGYISISVGLSPDDMDSEYFLLSLISLEIDPENEGISEDEVMSNMGFPLEGHDDFASIEEDNSSTGLLETPSESNVEQITIP